MRRPFLLCLCFVVVGWMAGCDSSSPGSAAGDQTDESGASARVVSEGSLRLDLVDYPVFQEGFDYGLRLEVDGAVVDERLLSDFDGGDEERVQDLSWSTAFDVRAGQVAVLSDLSIGPAGSPPPPDFSDPCRSTVTVEPGTEVRMVLNWTTGCAELVA